MTAKEEHNEDVSFKVTDRRKFNPDGSVKEGVTLDPIPEKTEPAKEPGAELPQPEAIAGAAPAPEPELSEPTGEDDEIPGAEDPASFVNFLSTLATNAAASLGAMPHPATGQRGVDLDSGKYWLDVLAMLMEKTKGNLHPQESRLLEGLLADLRMQYVTMVRATEDKLKEQAAKKFSGNDILGKKV